MWRTATNGSTRGVVSRFPPRWSRHGGARPRYGDPARTGYCSGPAGRRDRSWHALTQPPENGLGDLRSGVDPARLQEATKPAERAHLEHHELAVGCFHQVDAGEEKAEPVRGPHRDVDGLDRRIGALVAAARQHRRHPLALGRHPPIRPEIAAIEQCDPEVAAGVFDEALQIERPEAIEAMAIERRPQSRPG